MINIPFFPPSLRSPYFSGDSQSDTSCRDRAADDVRRQLCSQVFDELLGETIEIDFVTSSLLEASPPHDHPRFFHRILDVIRWEETWTCLLCIRFWLSLVWPLTWSATRAIRRSMASLGFLLSLAKLEL